MAITITKDDTPLKAAEKLIEGVYEEKVMRFTLKPKIFNLAQLEEIAGHLMAFVKANRAREKRNDE